MRQAYPKLAIDDSQTPSETSSRSFYKSTDPKMGEWAHLYNHEKRLLLIQFLI